MSARLVNEIWVASCWLAWQQFNHAAKNVKAVQNKLLKNYLFKNKQTHYGQRLKFATIQSAEQYQAQVPLTTYDDYKNYIAQISAGEPNVLTTDKVQMFEISSGSVAASKLIPYTHTLKKEFQRGISAWIYNLYRNMPALKQGSAYWSITPLKEKRSYTSGGIPIGFEDDSAYLGLLGKWLAEFVLAVPNSVKSIVSVESFRYLTLFYLLRSSNLKLISIWNPTFLSLLLDSLKQNWDSLLMDIETGKVNLGEEEIQVTPHPQRARRLRECSPSQPESIWPNLQLISVWADGNSALYLDSLKTYFPNTALQPKGLLATEAFVSFPILGVEGSVLAIHTHFFEFIAETGEVVFAHQLELGKKYAVVITTGAGFYRYQLNDLIEVIGFWQQAPTIRFIGKTDQISDWFGEKLNERFVANVLEKIFKQENHRMPKFFMLAPEEIDQFHYVLFIEDHVPLNESLAAAVETALCENFHYAWCRQLGQIGPLEVFPVQQGAEKYLRACKEQGQKLGNIKPSVLQKKTGWKQWFTKDDEIVIN